MTPDTTTAARHEAFPAMRHSWLDGLGPMTYIAVVILALLAIGVSFTALNVWLMFLFLDLDASDWEIGLLAEAATLAGATIGALLWARAAVLRVYRWLAAGEPAQGAQEVFALALDQPRRALPRIAALIMAFQVPVILLAHERSDVDVSPVATFFGFVETVAAATLLGFLVLEQMLRSLTRRAQDSAGGELVPRRSPVSLRRKLLVGLPIVNVMTGYIAAVLVGEAGSSASRVPLGIVAALGVSLTVSFVLTATLSRSLSEPVGELARATKRVEEGDLTAKVHPLAGDELGVLAARFNRMLDGLQERNALQEDVHRQADELRSSRARVVTASDAARRQVERDLHDGAQQHLVLLGLKLAMAQRTLAADPEAAAAALADVKGDLDRALDELRDLAHGIYPPLLENEGLAGALGEAVRRAGIPASLECDGAGRYPREVEAAVYFCCLEALQNASKHAGEGAKATVELAEHDGALTVTVADDGPGFDAAANGGGSGLQNMRDRIGALGGELSIDSAPGNGTRVTGRIPVEGIRA